MAEEKKRKLSEDYGFLNSKFVLAESLNTSLKSDNLQLLLQKSLSSINNKEALADEADKNKSATIEKSKAEMEQLKKRKMKKLRKEEYDIVKIIIQYVI